MMELTINWRGLELTFTGEVVEGQKGDYNTQEIPNYFEWEGVEHNGNDITLLVNQLREYFPQWDELLNDKIS